MSSNPDRKVTIQINEERLRLRPGLHPVVDLKAATKPPVAPNHSLWVDGEDGPDRELDSNGTVEITEDMVMYSKGPAGAHPHHFDISIDTKWVVSENESITGNQLRALAVPPVAADRDLYRSIVGAPDEKIDGDEVVTLADKAEFYSVPGLITPGSQL